jgi:hypothetical protein
MKLAGAQAMRFLLQRITRGTRWARAYRQLDSQCTLLQPMMEVTEERASLAACLDVAELAFCFGFPYADFRPVVPLGLSPRIGYRRGLDEPCHAKSPGFP